MEPERWQRLKDLFHHALERSPEQRGAFLAQMCAGDAETRAQIERLLDAHAGAGSFLETPAVGKAVEASPPAMTGHVIGHYELQARLGVGGMGEVYEAVDRRLKRTVAIKLVPTGDPRAQARLWREAQHASGLNHPNICVVHEIGEAEGLAYIVMERVEGQSLGEAIPEHGLPVDTAVGYAIQIAGALAHAHEHGIIHRDLKGANVMVTPEGRVKVLDFGLARRLDDATAGEGPESSSWTVAGAIAGTLGYMAPEVLRGQRGDVRGDVWALGIVLHEMFGGDRPFAGQTSFELSSAILSGRRGPCPRACRPPSSRWCVAASRRIRRRASRPRPIYTPPCRRPAPGGSLSGTAWPRRFPPGARGAGACWRSRSRLCF